MSKKPQPDASEIRVLDQQPDVPETSAADAPVDVESDNLLTFGDVKPAEDTPEARQAASDDFKAAADAYLEESKIPQPGSALADLGSDGSDWRLQQEIFQDACIIGINTDNRVRVNVKETEDQRHVEIYLVAAGDQLVYEADGKVTEVAASHKDSTFEVGMVAHCHPGKWVDYLKGKLREEALARIDAYDASRFSPVDDHHLF